MCAAGFPPPPPTAPIPELELPLDEVPLRTLRLDFESKSRIVSRTRDFLLEAPLIGGLAAAAAEGDAFSTGRPRVVACLWMPLPLPVLPQLVALVLFDIFASSLPSSRLGREIGLGILDLVKEVFRMPTTPLVSTAGVPAPEAEEHFEQLV